MTIFIIQGPTASGKSTLALDMAKHLDACIINADSMQLYKDLPILSAQPTREEQQQTPHRLYSILDSNQSCSAQQWRMMVQDILTQDAGNFKHFIITGGTGFYIKALIEGLSPIPNVPTTVRGALHTFLQQKGASALYNLLQQEDPMMAQKLVPQDTQRILRALEVYRYTGQSLLIWQNQQKKGALEEEFFTITLMPPREELYEKINTRVLRMLKEGVLEEIKKLQGQYLYGCERTLGYKELQTYLEDKISLAEAIEKTQQKSRNYAKRQTTWLRHQHQANIIFPKIYMPEDWQDFIAIADTL